MDFVSLDQLGLKHGLNEIQKPQKLHRGGDKSSQGFDYLKDYELLFYPLRNQKINLLEIGVLEGRSLLMWSDYFYQGTIVGLDIDLQPYYQHLQSLKDSNQFTKKYNEIIVIEGDSTNKNVIANLNDLAPFQIIIDDGNHLFEYQIRTFENLIYGYLAPGGIYIIEDCRSDEVCQYFAKLATQICLPPYRIQTAGTRKFIQSQIMKSTDPVIRFIESIQFIRRRIIIKKYNF